AARYPDQYQPDRLLPHPGGAAAALQGRDLGAVRRDHARREQLTRPHLETVDFTQPERAAGFRRPSHLCLFKPAFSGDKVAPFHLGGNRVRTSRRGFIGSVSAAALFSGSVAYAQKKYDNGASDTEIKIGHAGPYSGPASAYGVIGKGIEAY